jgi:hypothetical protein
MDGQAPQREQDVQKKYFTFIKSIFLFIYPISPNNQLACLKLCYLLKVFYLFYFRILVIFCDSGNKIRFIGH